MNIPVYLSYCSVYKIKMAKAPKQVTKGPKRSERGKNSCKRYIK